MVSAQKKQLVQKLTAAIKDYPIVGLVNLESLPAQQLQKMKAMLKKQDVQILMARKKLLELALGNCQKKNIEQLTALIKGMPAIILSKNNPFLLNSTIEQNKSEAPAKVGQIAPRDLMVKAGPTNFAPGPIISELAAVGIKTKVEAGKLAVISDTVIVKEGQVINQKVCETLKRMDIKPMEIGLKLVAVWEDGLVFEAKHLHIDKEEYVQNLTQAAQWAVNLAVEAAYPTTETTELLLQKAFREAKAVAVEQGILSPETTDEILAKSEREALSLKEEAQL